MIVTYGMSGLSQALLVKTRIHIEHVLGLLSEDVIHFPDFPTPFPVKRADFVRMKHDPRGSEMFSLIEEITEADLNSWGVIVNSFEDMEREHIPALESLYKEAKAWFVGPLLLSDQIDNEEEEDDDGNEDYCPYIDWLDKIEVGLGEVQDMGGAAGMGGEGGGERLGGERLGGATENPSEFKNRRILESLRLELGAGGAVNGSAAAGLADRS